MVLYYNNHPWAFQPSSRQCLLRYLMDVASAPFSARLQMPHLRNSRLKSLAGSMAKGSSSTMGPLAQFRTKQLDGSQTSTTGTADNQETVIPSTTPIGNTAYFQRPEAHPPPACPATYPSPSLIAVTTGSSIMDMKLARPANKAAIARNKQSDRIHVQI